MVDSNTANMVCPKCNKFQEKAESCKFCGIIVAKFTATQTNTQTSSTDPRDVRTPVSAVASNRPGIQLPGLSGIVSTTILIIGIAIAIQSFIPGSIDPSEKTDAEQEFEERIADLVENNADVNKVEDRGIPILYWAVEYNYVDSTKILLENGADPDTRPMKGAFETALFATATSLSYADDPLENRRMVRSKAVSELLIKHGANVNHSASKLKNTPLHKAALRGRTDLCEVLIQNGAKVHAPDALGNTPLHNAAKGGYWETAQFLLKNGARAKAADKLGKTALSVAELRQDEPVNHEIRKDTKLKYNPGSDYDRTIEVLIEYDAK